MINIILFGSTSVFIEWFISTGIKLIGSEAKVLTIWKKKPRSSKDSLCFLILLSMVFVMHHHGTLINTLGGSTFLHTFFSGRKGNSLVQTSSFNSRMWFYGRVLVESVWEQLRGLGIPIHPSPTEVTYLLPSPERKNNCNTLCHSLPLSFSLLSSPPVK